MKISFRQELPLLVIVALPFLYLAYIWNQLPAEVPLHWNINGEVDRYGSKGELLIIPLLVCLPVYFSFLLIPFIDPKAKIQQMGVKYTHLRLGMTLAMSILAIILLYLPLNPSPTNSTLIFFPIGFIFIISGNFMQTIRPNYFVGIRTPWTLENETVWKDTHRIGGMVMLVFGAVLVLASLLLSFQWTIRILLVISVLLVGFLMLYSYMRFQQVQKQE